MWIFCKQGFFSAVEHRDDEHQVMIRARFQGDLERLNSDFNLHAEIVKTEYADYMYRMVITKAAWAEVVKQIALQIDYDNFKNSVHEGGDSKRDEAYMNCWYALRQGQK